MGINSRHPDFVGSHILGTLLPKFPFFVGHTNYYRALESLCDRQILRKEQAPHAKSSTPEYGLTSRFRRVHLPGLFGTYAAQLEFLTLVESSRPILSVK